MHFLSACPKNLPGSDKVERVEEGRLGEEIPVKCQDEEACWLKNRNGVDRFSQAAKRGTDDCDDVPENEKTICKLFLGVGKRELNTVPSLKEPPARRNGLGNPLTRGFQPPCKPYPSCFYSPPGKKKFMVKKAARNTGHEEKVNAVPNSDTNDKQCDVLDLFCSGNGGVGRKRSVSRLIQVKLLTN